MCTFNRTNVELKYEIMERIRIEEIAFNRTNVELKLND